jgi:nucleoid-associated protein YgaU
MTAPLGIPNRVLAARPTRAAPRTRAQVTSAVLIDTRSGDRVPVMFNPEEYTLDQGNEVAEIGVPGLATSPVQYVRGRARTLRMELFYDTYELGADVRAHTQRIIGLLDPDPRTHVPPVLLFLMGTFSFQCVLLEANQQVTMFLADGTPVRARLSLRLQEYVRVEVETRTGLFVGPPTLHQVTQRDTLPDLAATYLGDPRRWREVAQANDVDDPLRLTPGRPLVIPRPGRPA